VRAGVLCIRCLGRIWGSHPQVVTGIVSNETILPSVLPATHLLRRREGSTDLSRLYKRDHSRSGQCYLPDKEFRYLRTVHAVTRRRFSRFRARTFLPRSACCHADRTVSSAAPATVWRAVSEDSPSEGNKPSHFESFLLIARPRKIFTAAFLFLTKRRVPSFQPGFPAYSQICSRNYSGPVHSYGRRLLGLRSRACTPSINLPAPGRRHTLYVHFRVCRVLCF
jgi:hypothetical protein